MRRQPTPEEALQLMREGAKLPKPSFGALPPRQMTRIEILEKIAALATELCVAVDREAEDIGGSRPSLKILQDIGPLTDVLERTPK